MPNSWLLRDCISIDSGRATRSCYLADILVSRDVQCNICWNDELDSTEELRRIGFTNFGLTSTMHINLTCTYTHFVPKLVPTVAVWSKVNEVVGRVRIGMTCEVKGYVNCVKKREPQHFLPLFGKVEENAFLLLMQGEMYPLSHGEIAITPSHLSPASDSTGSNLNWAKVK